MEKGVRLKERERGETEDVEIRSIEVKVKAGSAPVTIGQSGGARKRDPMIAAHVKEQRLKGVV